MTKFSVAFGLIFMALCVKAPAGRAQQANTAPPAVGVITASEQPVYNEQSYVGRIQSTQIVQLNARVTGYLEQQNFKDGDNVSKGELLYVIEQPPYQAAVDQAQAALEQAEAQAGNANITLARARALLRTPAGQQSTVDASKAAALSDAAQIDAAKAQLQSAQINLGYTEIRAPIDGQIGATTVDVGNVVGPNAGTLATIVAQDPMYVTFSLPAADALNLRHSETTYGLAGVDVLIKLPDNQIYEQTGRIDFVNNQITQTTDTLDMRATISNPPRSEPGNTDMLARELVSGEFVTVILRARAPQQLITIPRDAVITDQLGNYVLLVDNNDIVRRQAVTMGQATPESVAIISGLKSGDRVMTDGIQRVHPGIKVNPQDSENNPPPKG